MDLAPVFFWREELPWNLDTYLPGSSRYLLTLPIVDTPTPAILLWHGAGDPPRPMIYAGHWLADKKKIVLIAPELPRTERFESIAPVVFHCIVEDTGLAANLDTKRIYVFGNSMDGYLA